MSAPTTPNSKGMTKTQENLKPIRSSISKRSDKRNSMLPGLDSAERRRPFAGMLWYALLGTMAGLDFLSLFLPALLSKPLSSSHHKKEIVFETEQQWCSYTHATAWLYENGTSIYIGFSVLWFLDAFVRANEHRRKTLRKLDRERLLNKDINDNDDTWLSGAWPAYWKSVVLQLFFLPVGFYLAIWHFICGLTKNEFGGYDGVEMIFEQSNDGVPEFHETLSMHSTQSLAVALLHYLGFATQHFLGLKYMTVFMNVKAAIRPGIKRVTRKLAGAAIRHPRTFWRRVRKILTILRWIKYLAPVIGASNKLLGNVTDLFTKYTQNRAVKKAHQVRRKLLGKMSDEERREHAALVIQSRWRSHATQKRIRALNLLRGNKETLAAMQLQRVTMGMLARARVRLKKKTLELKRLREAEALSSQDNRKISTAERRRMYELEYEVGAECKEILNRKLLMRPSTKFSVIWKVLFVVCVIIEITSLVTKPMTEKYADNKKEPMKKMSFIEHKLLPKPIEEWDACAVYFKKKNGKSHRIGKLFQKVVRKVSKKDEHTKNSVPWYCHSPYPESQSVLIEILQFILIEFMVLVGIVCFLDVFVTFFTGEIDDDGMLVPKPFFARWLLPGLVLQLLVNPQMVNVSKLTVKTMQGILHVGPVRVARWTVALFIPASQLLFFGIQVMLWLPFVQNENGKLY